MGALGSYHAANLVGNIRAGVGAEPGDEGVEGEGLGERRVAARASSGGRRSYTLGLSGDGSGSGSSGCGSSGFSWDGGGRGNGRGGSRWGSGGRGSWSGSRARATTHLEVDAGLVGLVD